MGLRQKKLITPSAEVVDKHLILSLPNALEPVVWRMSLDSIGTASFEIKQTKADDSFRLVLKPKKGAAETIAPFEKKEDAVEALMQASDALLNPTDNVKYVQAANAEIVNTSQPANNVIHEKKSNRWLYLFIGFIAVMGLYIYLSSLVPQTIDGAGTPAIQTGEPQTGVPLSADDFLSGL